MPTPRKLILRNHQSPGDLVMLTAAVRDLHRCCPGEFLTDVRSSTPDFWKHNPHLTAIADNDPDAEKIQCHYPSIQRSNQEPYHFIHGFTKYLSKKLDRQITPQEFRGDIHLAQEEKDWYSQIYEIVGRDVPLWIMVAGRKFDYTLKWWSHERYQAVVDHFRGRLAFVQVGNIKNHHHHPLKGVIDLRGKTDLRQLVRLVYHSAGIVCPVTLLMHLAAAVEVKHPYYPCKNRPCVVVAGGREPPHWEKYPHHQFLHTVGALPCCDDGGCWKSRTVPIGDGDSKDRPGGLCVDVVEGDLPHCMDLITAEDVIRSIELYLKGRASREFSDEEWAAVEGHLS